MGRASSRGRHRSEQLHEDSWAVALCTGYDGEPTFATVAHRGMRGVTQTAGRAELHAVLSALKLGHQLHLDRQIDALAVQRGSHSPKPASARL